MRRLAVFAVFALVATGAFAATETLEMPDGATWTVMQPDVDGVTRPVAVADERSMPEYPDLATPLREDAYVVFSVVVDEHGKAQRLELRSASHPGLGFEDSAARALFSWTFDPATMDGRPVASYTNVRLRFAPPRHGRSVVSGMMPGGNAGGGFTNGSDRYVHAGGTLDGRAAAPSIGDVKGSSDAVTPAGGSQGNPATLSRSGTNKTVAPGQLYFRGHPEWGWKIYGSGPVDPDHR